STRNTRIERLWVEVGSQFARRWRAFFYRLEAIHNLDRSNHTHLWLLHRLFLPMINADCADFQAEWNSHPISRAGHDQSPADMLLLGQLTNGIYVDDCVGVDVESIREHYGIHGPARRRAPGQAGAGHLLDEDDESVGHIEAATDHHFHEEPASVPKYKNPFSDEDLPIFDAALAEANRQQILPPGYGIRQEEWEEGSYSASEFLTCGRKGGKRLEVALPNTIWLPRAQLWVRGLAVMEELIHGAEQSSDME
ncbi:hypothetical protein FB45DRAFT_748447, partial [Roridomyces roridus]